MTEFMVVQSDIYRQCGEGDPSAAGEGAGLRDDAAKI
jgi:hypothetical protein